MIVTANKYVNARIGKPYRNAQNPYFLEPGDQVNVTSKVFGENLEGSFEWLLTDKNEFFTKLGFIQNDEIDHLAFNNTPNIFNKLRINDLWNYTESKGENINIGIIDLFGVADYKALKGRVTGVNYDIKNADPTKHSTCMASIIAAKNPDENEIGIAPGIAKIFSYKIEDKNINSLELLKAISALREKGVNIINMSIASTKYSLNDYANLRQLLQEMTTQNILFVSSTGNFPMNSISYPAALKNVISVAGFNFKNDVEWDSGSNVWNDVRILAPYNPYFDNSFLQYKGTSNACAIISGLLACSYKKIINQNVELNLYDYLSKSIFSKLSTISDGNIRLPFYNTENFINLLKKTL